MKSSKRFCFEPDKNFQLIDIDPDNTRGIKGKDEAEGSVAANVKLISELQERLYAENRQSLLIVLQGMDAAGKDGTIRHVMTGLNPQGCAVTSFKVPSQEELAHDFLWRIHRATPARGQIGIFNRSHYEDVLAVRVHNLVPEAVWKRRYDQINEFEKNLVKEGTTILKFFLHISKDEQKKRLQERLRDPSTNWKFTMSDLSERKLWSDYQKAYGDMLSQCSTQWAPWHIIPANHKWYRNAAVSTVIRDTLRAMNPQIPSPKVDMRRIRII